MPIVKLSLYNGRTTEELKKISYTIQLSIKESFNIDHDNFHFRIFEFDDNTMYIPPGKSKNYILIELDLFPGKPKEQKNIMYKKIEEELKIFKINQDDILIIFREPLLENWYIRGKTAEEMFQNK